MAKTIFEYNLNIEYFIVYEYLIKIFKMNLKWVDMKEINSIFLGKRAEIMIIKCLSCESLF